MSTSKPGLGSCLHFSSTIHLQGQNFPLTLRVLKWGLTLENRQKHWFLDEARILKSVSKNEFPEWTKFQISLDKFTETLVQLANIKRSQAWNGIGGGPSQKIRSNITGSCSGSWGSFISRFAFTTSRRRSLPRILFWNSAPAQPPLGWCLLHISIFMPLFRLR